MNDVEFKIQHKAGHYLDISFEGCIGYNPDGSFKQTYCVFKDITERKQSEIKLDIIYKRLTNTMANMTDGFVSLDTNWNYTYLNERAAEMVGRKPEELIGKHIWTEFPEEIDQPFYKNYHKAFETKQSISFEEYYPPWGLWFENRIIPSEDGLAIFFQDITERKLANIELVKAKEIEETSKNYLDSIINNIGDPIFVKDDHSKLLLVNDAFCSIFGLSRDQIIGKTLAEDVHETERENFLSIDNQVLSDGIENIKEESLTVRNGKTRIITTRKTRYIDKVGKKYLVGIIHDITEQKQIEEELKESLIRERLMADIVRESVVGIAIGYPDGKLGMCNSAFQKITGYNEEELKSINWNKKLTPPEWEESESTKLQELHRTKKPVQYEKEYIRKDGSRTPIELIVNPQFDDKGEVEYYFAFVIDISERKKIEIKLKDNQNYLSAVFNNTLDAQISSKYEGGEDFTVIAINDTYIKKINKLGLKVTREDLIGKSLKELVLNTLFLGLKVFNYTLKFYKKAIDDQRRVSYNESFIINEKQYHSETLYIPIFNSEGGDKYILFNSHDITERRQAEHELTKYRENLEDLVKERTQELETKNKDLEKFNDLFVDREFRIKELRDELEELKNR